MSTSDPEIVLEAALEQTRTYHAALDAETLADTLQNLVATRRQSLWLICRYLADMAEDRRCGAVGYDSVFDFAWKELGMKKRMVRERVRVGRALRDLPAIQEAFVVGRLGFGRVREIVRVATPETEQDWLRAALELPMRQLEAMVAEAGGSRPSRHTARTEDRGGDLIEVRLVLPVDVWQRLEDAMATVAAAEGNGLTQAEALAAVAELARTQAASRERPAPAPADPNVWADEVERDDPIGSRGAFPRRTRVRSAGAAGDCRGGPTIQPAADPPQSAGSTGAVERSLSPEADAMLGVLGQRRKWAPDQLGAAADLKSGAGIAAGLTELEMAGYLEKVAGGYRVVPPHRRPLN